jgi:hypothetical protein
MSSRSVVAEFETNWKTLLAVDCDRVSFLSLCDDGIQKTSPR